MLAQEAGDIPAARAALKACSDLCIRLELNRHINARSYECDDQDLEAYYCFALCYLNDKGMALNLLESSFMNDATIDLDVLQHPDSTVGSTDNFSLYLELAQVQSRITSELLPTKSNSRPRATIISRLAAEMNQIWHSKIRVCQNITNISHIQIY